MEPEPREKASNHFEVEFDLKSWGLGFGIQLAVEEAYIALGPIWIRWWRS